MSNNKKVVASNVLVGSLFGIGGLALGVGGTVLFNLLKKKKKETKETKQTNNNNTGTNYHSQIPTASAVTGVYIQDGEDKILLTNEEFQRYFELNVKGNSGVELDWCLLDYALKLDPLNLKFFTDEQKTQAFERFAVKNNIEALLYCRGERYEDVVNNLEYVKYDVEDFAYDLYQDKIYDYIDDSFKKERNILRQLKKKIKEELRTATMPKFQNTEITETTETEDVQTAETEDVKNVENVEIVNINDKEANIIKNIPSILRNSANPVLPLSLPTVSVPFDFGVEMDSSDGSDSDFSNEEQAVDDV